MQQHTSKRGSLAVVRRIVQHSGSAVRLRAIGRRLMRDGLLAPTNRQALLMRASQAGEVLEIGPFDNPQLSGPNVAYFDVLDAEALRARAQHVGRNPSTVPFIHHVSGTGDLSVIRRTFDAVLSCHSIEHQPDLIQHLVDVGRILRPGGSYFVIVPDKRFTFDHFLRESTHEEVLAAHAEKRRVHTAQSVNLHFTMTTHNSSLRHWLGWHGHPRHDDEALAFAADACRRAEAGEYIDVHAWVFTPAGMLQALRRLRDARMIPFSGIEVYETEFLDLEFFAVLSC